MIQQRHRFNSRSMPCKEHLQNSNDIAILDEDFFNFGHAKPQETVDDSSIQWQRALSAVLLRKNKHAFLVDLVSYLQFFQSNLMTFRHFC